MHEALILKLIILALGAIFIAVIIALVLSFSVTQKLMKHNANLINKVQEGDKQQASAQQTLYEKEHELLKTEEQLKKALEEIDNMMRQAHQADKQQASAQQTLYEKERELLKADEQFMGWIGAQIESQGLYRSPNVTLKEISKVLSLTQRRISQVIKTRREDNTLAEYLNTKRQLEGCRLLVEQTNWTVDAIAHEAGFGGTTTSRTIFRSRFGMSPKQYREKKRLMG